ncbi:unnamed protein product [Caenorhabditis brenneri]
MDCSTPAPQNDTMPMTMATSEGAAILKVLGFALTCFITTLCSGLGSVTLLSWIKKWVNMTVIQCVSIGVFGCLAFVHFVPELVEHEMEYKMKYIPKRYHDIQICAPIVFFAICLMTVMDSMAHGMEGHGDEGSNHESLEVKKKQSNALLILAVGLHSFLEGLPVGVENKAFWSTSIPLGLHKIFEAITVAATFMHNSKGSFLRLGVYAAMTPLGSLFGVFVATVDGQVADTVNLILVSLSVGLINFICLTESLGAVLRSHECGAGVKFVIMMASFFVMYSFSIVTSQAFKD